MAGQPSLMAGSDDLTEVVSKTDVFETRRSTKAGGRGVFSEGFHVRYDVQAQKKAEERLMQSKPKAYVFLEEFLEKAGIRKGHQPGYIKELYPGIA